MGMTKEEIRKNATDMKGALASLEEMFSSIAEKAGLDAEDSKLLVRMDLLKFMLYLSASDGHVSWDEVDIIGEICGMPSTPDASGKFIREHNIYSTEFEQTVPESFKMLVQLDNALLDAGINLAGNASETTLKVYQMVGTLLISSDGTVHENEERDFNIYINMMRRFRDENYKGTTKGDAYGFTKTTGGVPAPEKGGVKAPEKR